MSLSKSEIPIANQTVPEATLIDLSRIRSLVIRSGIYKDVQTRRLALISRITSSTSLSSTTSSCRFLPESAQILVGLTILSQISIHDNLYIPSPKSPDKPYPIHAKTRPTNGQIPQNENIRKPLWSNHNPLYNMTSHQRRNRPLISTIPLNTHTK